ncbi:hypothetical protein PI125_g5029 [Phytophthora idaei]|nr:hypothetical protein PI125_g5029 [Phytophthora idaei]
MAPRRQLGFYKDPRQGPRTLPSSPTRQEGQGHRSDYEYRKTTEVMTTVVCLQERVVRSE